MAILESSANSRPIMRLLDLIGQRWALRILWELRDGPLRSRAIRAVCDDVSPTVLQKRLSELRAGDLVMLSREGYSLTKQGNDFIAAFVPLYLFADKWNQAVSKPNSES